ncbi:NAD(P)/FAD-dependent oxidoreductase [Vulcanisaeta distributa]|uniref:Monooxygenase FAD-binding protein n=1 Tax=Vulcanisaeta distributa (strain DSM 14429 / JCM 11212 / NBRC 100878 / IC-017) TaxID=572478 RepID=E1QUJ9_VULDI|nr:NAD(P)/FAD-dependent oxidoreductase [Vulcanisaeta distributa]ADN51118.1 monooxygenase FAD-binding protein [Vulcanisaeta distributa DSM 14429]
MSKSDAVIIGAGPSGLYLARELSKVMNVTIFEEDKMLGMPPHCTGLVNLDSLKSLGISPPVINTYRYVRITDLNGNSITFDFKRRAIAMLDRPGLEHYLADGLGSATLMLGERVVELSNGFIRTRARQEAFSLAVIAEGANMTLTRNIIPWKPVHVYGVQTDTKSFSISELMPRSDEEIVVIFDRKLSEHYFAWIVPKDFHEFRVGLADDANVWVKFTELLKIIKAEQLKPFGGKIIIGGSPSHVVMGNTAVIGDAGGFVKPMTGGGIIMGMLSARLLAESINSAIKEGLSINDALFIYDTLFRKYIKGKVKALSSASYILHMMINRSLSYVMQSMSKVSVDVDDYDNHIDAILRAASKRPWSFIRAIFSVIDELSLIEPGTINKLIKELME